MVSEVLSIASPVHAINEDSWLLFEAPDSGSNFIIGAVIDGASTRYPIASFEAYLLENLGITSGAFASITVRNSLLDNLTESPQMNLKMAMLAANDALRERFSRIVGGFSDEHLASLHPEAIQGNMRRIRLILPSCVATLIRVNIEERLLEYAHVGDTALLEVSRHGETTLLTPDQMRKYDDEMLRFAKNLQRKKSLPHFKDAVRLPAVISMNKENGLRHNYVDFDGKTVLNDGCGALDGLQELSAYISTGSVVIDPQKTIGYCLVSDGLQLLRALDETPRNEKKRLDRMGSLIIEGNLKSLFDELKNMITQDQYYNNYPRFKNQDDATGIWLWGLE